jgi:excisionase family DNA binding protein
MSNPHLSVNDLIASLVDDIANRVADRLSDVVVDSGRPEELMDEPAMAALLGVSQQTLERSRKEGKVPCVRLGRRVLYRHQAVLEALSETATGGPEE